jgi:hypothetical protein
MILVICGLVSLPEVAGAFAVQDTLRPACPGVPPIPFEPHYLLADPVRDVILVTQSAGPIIAALDPRTRQCIDCTDIGTPAWRLALDAADRRLYVLQYTPPRIIVLNADTYALLDTLPCGPDAQAFAIQPDTDKLYISNKYHETVTVVDAMSGAILHTIPIFHPGDLSVSRKHNRIYVPGWDGRVWVIDGEDDAIVDQRQIFGGICESDLTAYDELRDRLYISPFNCPFLTVLDGTTLETLAGDLWLPGYPLHILADEETGRAYVTAESSLAVVGPDLSVNEVLTLDGCSLGHMSWHAATQRMFVHGTRPGPVMDQFMLVLGETQGVPTAPAPSASPIMVRANPFFDLCSITCTIPEAGPWSLAIHGLDGRLVRRLAQGTEAACTHVVWDGTDTQGRSAPSGAYFCRLQASGLRASARVLRLR